MGVNHIFHGHHHDNFQYNINHNRPYKITNVGFRSLCNVNGEYLLIGIDDREK